MVKCTSLCSHYLSGSCSIDYEYPIFVKPGISECVGMPIIVEDKYNPVKQIKRMYAQSLPKDTNCIPYESRESLDGPDRW